MRAMASLKYSGTCSLYVSSQMKSTMIKAYVTPVLIYGTETLSLNANEMTRLVNVHNSIVKSIICLSKFSHHTQLLLALKIITMENIMKKNKLSFTLRLLRYGLTKTLCIHRLMKIDDGRYVAKNDIIKDVWNEVSNILDG